MFVSAQTLPRVPVTKSRQVPSLVAVEALLDDSERLMNEWRIEKGAGSF